MENKLTVEELEVLIESYYECLLSREEEDYLRRVLVASEYSSEAIDRCRMEMGLEAFLKERPQMHRRERLPWLRYVAVAASVAVVAGLAVVWVGNRQPALPDNGEEAIAYISGKRIGDQTYAMTIAERDRKECMAMLQEISDAGKSQQQEFFQELQEAENLRKKVLYN